MSAPPKKQPSSHQPVVQTILESFTRCFNPLEPCTKVCTSSKADDISINGNNNGGGGGSAARKSSSPSPPLLGLNISGDKSSSLSRAVSRSSSTTDSRNRKNSKKNQQQQSSLPLQLDVSYDADGVASAKKVHHRMMKMSPEALEERSMKRKLEIFRGTSTSTPTQQDRLAPRKQQQHQSSRSSSSRSSSPNNSNIIISRSSKYNEQLVLSDDEEELLINNNSNSSSRKRFACGMNITDRFTASNNGKNSPISSVARFFNLGMTEAHKQGFLCFATPVRTASQEDIANLSDDRLTDDEFLRKHSNNANNINNRGGGGLLGNANSLITPNTPTTHDQSSTSYCEEETISSTLYFDQKYSHVVQTRPPMPLFQDDLVNCTESRMDDLSKIIKRRSVTGGESMMSSSVPLEVTSKKHCQQHVRGSSSRGSSRSPKMMSNSNKSSIFKVDNNNDLPPSPMRIGDESLSMNTQSVEDESIHTSFHEDTVMDNGSMKMAEF